MATTKRIMFAALRLLGKAGLFCVFLFVFFYYHFSLLFFGVKLAFVAAPIIFVFGIYTHYLILRYCRFRNYFVLVLVMVIPGMLYFLPHAVYIRPFLAGVRSVACALHWLFACGLRRLDP